MTICLILIAGHVRVNGSGSEKTCTWLQKAISNRPLAPSKKPAIPLPLFAIDSPLKSC